MFKVLRCCSLALLRDYYNCYEGTDELVLYNLNSENSPRYKKAIIWEIKPSKNAA